MQKKSIKLDVDGLILINKPYGLSSNHALTRIKKKIPSKKSWAYGYIRPSSLWTFTYLFGPSN